MYVWPFHGVAFLHPFTEEPVSLPGFSAIVKAEKSWCPQSRCSDGERRLEHHPILTWLLPGQRGITFSEEGQQTAKDTVIYNKGSEARVGIPGVSNHLSLFLLVHALVSILIWPYLYVSVQEPLHSRRPETMGFQ